MRFKFAVPGLVAAVALGAIAGQGLAAPPQLFDGFTVDNVTPILREAGATDIKTQTVENEPRVTFKMTDTTLVADLYECEDKAKGCMLLQFVVAFDPDPTDTVAAVNIYNKKYVYGKAVLDKDEGLMSMRMVNGNGGSSKTQVAAELNAFLGATSLLLTHMKESAVTAYVPNPNTAPLALSRLSARSAPRNKRR